MKYIDRLALILIPLLMFLWLFGTGIWILTGPNIKTCNGTLFDETGMILVASIVGYRIMFKRGDRLYFYVAFLAPSVIGIVLVGGCYLSVLTL